MLFTTHVQINRRANFDICGCTFLRVCCCWFFLQNSNRLWSRIVLFLISTSLFHNTVILNFKTFMLWRKIPHAIFCSTSRNLLSELLYSFVRYVSKTLWNHVILNYIFWFHRVDSADRNYRLWISGYSGNATDSFSDHNGSEFSTVDNINDRAPKCCPCAKAYGGGWWFHR